MHQYPGRGTAPKIAENYFTNFHHLDLQQGAPPGSPLILRKTGPHFTHFPGQGEMSHMACAWEMIRHAVCLILKVFESNSPEYSLILDSKHGFE
jgi:hypothetical protein